MKQMLCFSFSIFILIAFFYVSNPLSATAQVSGMSTEQVEEGVSAEGYQAFKDSLERIEEEEKINSMIYQIATILIIGISIMIAFLIMNRKNVKKAA